jgi:DivIVA domain-containing protein
MDIDRQAIERRDFPITRRGYDPAAVDAHLRALASEIQELVRAGAAGPSLAGAASAQVQGIVHAAEAAAAEVQREAEERARELRSDAEADAQGTREEAIAKARAHLAAVAQATSSLRARIDSLDGETGALLGSLRASAQRLGADLSALEANLAELYDAASAPDLAPGPERPARPAATPAQRAGASTAPAAAEQAPASTPPPPAVSASPAASAKPENGDLDGARLVALNMALSGKPRAATERYLAEHFQLAERDKLIDEVYAAVEA